MTNTQPEGGSIAAPFSTLLNCPHLLIAGATGSGKSVLINGLVRNLIRYSPDARGMVLIDPKRVELVQYKNLPHVLRYANTDRQAAEALRYAVRLMMKRYDYMSRRGIRKWPGGSVWVMIDEYADLVTTNKREIVPLVLRIAQLGRAAGIHLCIATQRPTRDIITGSIKVNLDYRIALHCPTRQDSRNVIEQAGAEALPLFGSGLYYSPAGLELLEVPMVSDEEISEAVQHWTRTDQQPGIMNKLKAVFI